MVNNAVMTWLTHVANVSHSVKGSIRTQLKYVNATFSKRESLGAYLHNILIAGFQ